MCDPDFTRGPLLGIFITGPIGAMLGGVLGAIFGPSIHLPAKRT